MLRVYGVVCFIEKYWTGKNVDWTVVKTIALLHDMGNIIKFKFDVNPEKMGLKGDSVEYWKKVQKEMIDKYGSDEEEATGKMLREVGVDEDSIQRIHNKAFGNSVAIMNSTDWHLKLLYYADLRTLPLGVGTLEERLADVRLRMPKYTSRPDFEDLVDSCREIEKQIRANLSIDANTITEDKIKIDRSVLQNFEI